MSEMQPAAIHELMPFCARFDEKSNIWNFKMHSHDCVEILYILSGTAQINAPDARFYASFHDIIVYPVGCMHTEYLIPEKSHHIYCMWINTDAYQPHTLQHLYDSNGQIKATLEWIYNEYHSEEPSEAILKSYIDTLVLLLTRAAEIGDERHSPTSRATMYMRDHMSEPITVDMLTELVHISRPHLNRLFKKEIGMSPIEYLHEIRIDAARTLLLTGNSTIDEITALTGFSSPKYFFRLFKQKTGLTPTEFRRENRNKQD